MNYPTGRFSSFVRFVERYTKIDASYLLRGGSLTLLGQIAGLAASLCLAIVVSHFIPKDAYGTYKYILSIVTLFSLFSLNNISAAVFQSAAQGYDGVLLKAFRDNIRWSLMVFLAALLVGGYYIFAGNLTLGVGILAGGMFSPFLASASLFNTFLGGKKDFFRQMVYGVADTVIPIGIFIGVTIVTQNPLTLVITYFVTNTLAALFFYRRTISVYAASMNRHDATMLTYSKHLSVMGIISGIADSLDQVLLFHFVGAAQLAVYNFAIAIPNQIKGPSKSVAAMLQVRFVERSNHEIQDGMRNKILWSTVVSVLVTVTYILAVPIVFRLLFPEYIEAERYSQIYSVWILSLAVESAGAYIAAKKLTRELYIGHISYSVIQISTLLVGVWYWGVLGVVIARVVTRFAINILNYVLYRLAIGRELRAA